MFEARSARLRLVAADLPMSHAELEDRPRFAALLAAQVPEEWPPDSAADALPWFLERLEQDADARGWLAWYALLQRPNEPELLVAGGGFKGPPDEHGVVETGYSVLPRFQGLGLATELLDTLVHWAFAHGARVIVAETDAGNHASQRVLSKAGFVAAGAGSEPDALRFTLGPAA